MTANAKFAAVIDAVSFDKDGLAPVIVQQHDTREVLMLAWMNREALQKTLASGDMYYWSRSRQTLWQKGQSSGQTQRLKELLIDCDHDSVLARVEQTGVACHTGRRSCFFQAVRGGKLVITAEPLVSPETLYGKNGD